MTTQTTATADTRDSRQAAQDGQAIAPPPKLRRRPLLWAIGIALIALGGLGAAYVATAMSNTQAVVALRADVDRGATISAEDLVTAQVPADPALSPVPAAERDDVIGQKATRDLNAGSLLTSDAFAGAVIPAEGEALVGVALKRAQMPGTPLRQGDTVRVVNTPRDQENLPQGQPTSLVATVVGTRTVPEEGIVVVDVTVPKNEAARLVSLVATARVGLVVDSGEGEQ